MGGVDAKTKPKRLASSAKAAKVAGLSPNAISRRVKAGLISTWTDPTDLRLRLVDLDELEDYLSTPTRVQRRNSDPVRAA